MNDQYINKVHVENCCKSFCDGCPWAIEELRIEQLIKDEKSKNNPSETKKN